MNTPYHKDIVKALANECHKQGIKLFLYYSILDWYRTDYQYTTGRTGQGTGRTAEGDWDNYIQFMKDQLTELLTQYGSIGGIWLDGHWDQVQWNEETKEWIGKSKVDWHYDEIYPLIHRLQPHALIGNNHHLAPFPGEDFQMFERDLPGQNTTGWGTDTSHVSQLPLETCQTINGSWGYNITDTSYKSTKELIHFLIKAAGNNANLLLNIGPMPNGEIQSEFKKRLDAVGNWRNKYGKSIYGTRGGYLKPQDWGTMTQKGNIIYLHILNPETTTITLPGFNGKIKSINRMATNSPVGYHKKNDRLQISCGKLPSDMIDEVLIVTLKE